MISFSQENTPNGRKYKLALISLLVAVAGFAIIVMNPTTALIGLYGELTSAIFLINTAYYGGNVANKWATKKPLTPETRTNTVNEGDQEDGNVRG